MGSSRRKTQRSLGRVPEDLVLFLMGQIEESGAGRFKPKVRYLLR